MLQYIVFADFQFSLNKVKLLNAQLQSCVVLLCDLWLRRRANDPLSREKEIVLEHELNFKRVSNSLKLFGRPFYIYLDAIRFLVVARVNGVQ